MFPFSQSAFVFFLLIASLALLSRPVCAGDGGPRQVIAADGGALVCGKLDHLKTYLDIQGDAGAITAFLASNAGSSCQQLSKGTPLLEMQSVEVGKGFVALRKQGEFTPSYGLVSEWQGAAASKSEDTAAAKDDYVPQIEWGRLADLAAITNVRHNGNVIEFDVKCKDPGGYVLAMIGMGGKMMTEFLDKDGVEMGQLNDSFFGKAIIIEKKYPNVLFWSIGETGKGVLYLPDGLALNEVHKIKLSDFIPF